MLAFLIEILICNSFYEQLTTASKHCFVLAKWILAYIYGVFQFDMVKTEVLVVQTENMQVFVFSVGSKKCQPLMYWQA